MHERDRTALIADLREGRLDVLVSTSCLEAGLDLSFGAVVLVGFPVFGAAAALVQRVGRCGRRSHGYAFFVPGPDVYW
jgi:DEAD/DEAH box helicase domain-containing protein